MTRAGLLLLGLAVELADGRAVGALDVVSVDFQLGFGCGFGFLGKEQILI